MFDPNSQDRKEKGGRGGRRRKEGRAGVRERGKEKNPYVLYIFHIYKIHMYNPYIYDICTKYIPHILKSRLPFAAYYFKMMNN